MKNIKCRSCFFYRNEWCEKIVDSPDPEKARDCNYFREMTNADRIRAMSDEELVEFIKNIKVRAALCKAVKNNDAFEELCSAEWLQQPADEDDHDERKENENV